MPFIRILFYGQKIRQIEENLHKFHAFYYCRYIEEPRFCEGLAAEIGYLLYL